MDPTILRKVAPTFDAMSSRLPGS